MTDGIHGTGYLFDHPLEIASRTSDMRWHAGLLLGDGPLATIPSHFVASGLRSTALDQDGIGACVAFSGTLVQDTTESHDEGAGLFATGTWTNSASSTGTYRNYWDLKHGYGSFPGDGIPGVDGSIPEALWKLALAEGLVDKNGRRHKITAYYAADFGNADDLAVMQRVIMAAGPVQFGIPWPSNWMSPPHGPSYRMPLPGDPFAGHAIACVGWETDPDGTVWLIFVQTWGPDWSDARGTYKIKASWLWAAPLGPQQYWVATDRKDAPRASTLHIAAGARVRHYGLTSSGLLTDSRVKVWGVNPSTASCGPLTRKFATSGGSVMVVHVPFGALAGRWVKPGTGVTVTTA